VETWVSDASGDPVLVVMAAPGASLAMELRRLLPDLRRAVGDQRRVLVGFDRGGWSPVLFAHMHAQGFDVLTWRKGLAENLDPDLFTGLTYTDETGRVHQWRVADSTVDLPTSDEQVFTMRQVTLIVANNKTGRGEHGQDSTRQIHILTTRADLPVEQVIYRMGSRWRQENYFHYARMHFDLDSHDAYATTDDDPTGMVPNPAKKKAHKQLLAARARYERALAATDAALLEAVSPPPRESVLITNTDHDRLTADLRAAESDLDTAQAVHRAIPARLPLAQVNPGQQVLDIQTKLISHAIRIAAFNTATALARAIRVHTGYARANHESHSPRGCNRRSCPTTTQPPTWQRCSPGNADSQPSAAEPAMRPTANSTPPPTSPQAPQPSLMRPSITLRPRSTRARPPPASRATTSWSAPSPTTPSPITPSPTTTSGTAPAAQPTPTPTP
jgi:hypothetical protein